MSLQATWSGESNSQKCSCPNCANASVGFLTDGTVFVNLCTDHGTQLAQGTTTFSALTNNTYDKSTWDDAMIQTYMSMLINPGQ